MWTGTGPGCSTTSSLRRATTDSDTDESGTHSSSASSDGVSSGRVISIATSFGTSSRMSRRPRTQTIASSSSRIPCSAIVFGNTNTSIADSRSSSTNVAINSPRRV